MARRDEFYIVDRNALPEVFLQVVEAKRLLSTGRAETVQDAVTAVGISRSSFYKYKDMIEPFSDTVRKKTVTIAGKLEDTPGVLSQFFRLLGETGVNILTVHQSIPINGQADITVSMEVLEDTWPIEEILNRLQKAEGVHSIRVLARE